MTENQKALAKGIFVGATLKKKSNLTKSYLALAFAALYGIRAAREASQQLDTTVESLQAERSRPVIVVDG